jgi:glycosyltransferase involved in cell wall biosynthesis
VTTGTLSAAGGDEEEVDGMRISYLATNYPFVSHTFIQGEIAALEQLGVEVVPIALNKVRPADVLSPLDEREAARTYHVKATPPAAIAATLLRTLLRHPLAFLKGIRRSVHGPPGIREVGKRLFQFAEAVLVWHHCVGRGVTGIHAHFGQAPATVARYAAAFGNDAAGSGAGRARWTWSVTIHGWHEFATEDSSDLRTKFADADLVVAISDFTRAQILRLSGSGDWAKIGVVRCGIDVDEFPAREPRPVGDPPVVVVVARLSPEKGHGVLLEAMRILAGRGVEVRARFIGDGPFEADLRKAISRLRLDGSVELLGPQPPSAVAEALRDADVFCLPSFAEGLPVSIMEAMAIGVPVVTTFISGTPELVDDTTGWIVPAGNAEALADAVAEVLSNPTAADAKVGAARDAVLLRHDRSRNSKELADLLERCHGGSS